VCFGRLHNFGGRFFGVHQACEMANRLNHHSAAFLALTLGLLAPAAGWCWSTSDWCKALRRRWLRSDRDNYDRLGTIKNHYDPTNLSDVNQKAAPI
jgi:hypothetical protein